MTPLENHNENEKSRPKKTGEGTLYEDRDNKIYCIFLEIIMAETAGMIRKEKTGITPLIFYSKYNARPI
jgi:hypothetical protein